MVQVTLKIATFFLRVQFSLAFALFKIITCPAAFAYHWQADISCISVIPETLYFTYYSAPDLWRTVEDCIFIRKVKHHACRNRRAAKRDARAAKRDARAAKRDACAAKRDARAAKRDTRAAKQDSGVVLFDARLGQAIEGGCSRRGDLSDTRTANASADS